MTHGYNDPVVMLGLIACLFLGMWMLSFLFKKPTAPKEIPLPVPGLPTTEGTGKKGNLLPAVIVIALVVLFVKFGASLEGLNNGLNTMISSVTSEVRY